MLDSLRDSKPGRNHLPGIGIQASAQPHSAHFISNPIFLERSFRHNHPLSIPRQSGVVTMCSILGWLDEASLEPCPVAIETQLEKFHDPSYIHALKQASRTGSVGLDVRERYNIGTMENPVFKGLFERASTTVGGSIMAAEAVINGGVAFHPAGGTHHGRPDRASGFCYFNDPVFAILTLLDAGIERVMYVDLDAHHGDGVQNAMAGNERVFTLSIHEQGRWPHSGLLTDRGQGQARNLPVPREFNDSELDFLIQHAVLPLIQQFEPQALVVTCGADGLAGDPLSKMELSNLGLWKAVEDLITQSPRSVVLGGGGYNPWTVVRCWTGLWGQLSGQDIPGYLPPEASKLLKSFSCELLDEDEVDEAWINTLADQPNHGIVREEVIKLAQQVLI